MPRTDKSIYPLAVFNYHAASLEKASNELLTLIGYFSFLKCFIKCPQLLLCLSGQKFIRHTVDRALYPI